MNRILKLLDDFLNGITMYRLVLYVLIGFCGSALALSFFGVLPVNPVSLLFSAFFLTLICWVVNKLFAKAFKVPTNLESTFITALILSLIITPANSPKDLIFPALAGFLAMGSKYILAINKKHIFNPAAISVVLTTYAINQSASWWIGTTYMLPFVLLGGLLILRKIRRFSLVLTFFLATLTSISAIQGLILETPLIFFAFIMLTEPQTTPPTRFKQIMYGGLVGLGFSYLNAEVALVLSNIFSYIISPKEKLLLKLKEKIKIATDTYEFVFNLKKKFSFSPGQYMEWTLRHKNPDSRGNRRYFTIASSPTEENLRIGVKFYPNSSSFKKALLDMQQGDEILTGQLSGEFILPKDPNKKLVFIAGGIGVTPFRSMIKYLLDTNQKRDIILFYSNKTASDVVYKEIFDLAQKRLGVKIVYVATDTVGYITKEMIKKEALDYKDSIFYISGPHSMVDAFEKTLKDMGITSNQIKIDFFPGYV